MYDVIIIGAGISGLSAAYHMAEKGSSILLLDKGKAGKEATHAAAGMLGAQTEMHHSREIFRYAVRCRDYFQTFAEELEAAAGISIHYRREGAWKFAASLDERTKLQRLIQLHQEEGSEVKTCSEEELSKYLPEINAAEQAAAYFPEETQVDARSYAAALAKAVQKKGVTLSEDTEVLHVNEGSSSWEVHTKNEVFHGEKLLLSSGTTSLLDLDVPEVVPVKGECISLMPDKPLFSATLVTPDVYLVPKGDGRVIIGATETEGDSSKSVRAGAVQELLHRAFALVPALAEAPVHEIWAGVRPKSKDGFPFAGKVKDNLYISSGYYRNGILMSGLSGKLIGEAILQEAEGGELNLLNPDRRMIL